ncbi:MAG: hypothetical protein WC632_00155 [Candidatus Margulisiibacteriota bacterium]
MKRVLTFSLIAMLVLTTASFAAVKKTVKPAATTKTATPAPVRVENPTPADYGTTGHVAQSGGLVVSPKLGFGTGGLNSFFLGCEVAYPVMPSVDVMGEVEYYMVSGGSIITVAGNGVYHFAPIAGAPGNFYAGGGLLYQSIGGVNASAIGFQGFGGMDYQLAGSGTVFGQIKYAIANYTFSVGGISFSTSSGGLVLEGGYRFYL